MMGRQAEFLMARGLQKCARQQEVWFILKANVFMCGGRGGVKSTVLYIDLFRISSSCFGKRRSPGSGSLFCLFQFSLPSLQFISADCTCAERHVWSDSAPKLLCHFVADSIAAFDGTFIHPIVPGCVPELFSVFHRVLSQVHFYT